ncbi:MAG: DNA polymerase III subunit beta [Hydrotalea sp.]|nr:DNA polymerase III subunit beta [Hydrotalea sp.]
MKLSIEKAALQTALSRVGSAIDKKGTIAILSNIKMVAEKSGRAIFTATDLDIQIVSGVAASVATAGEITLPGIKLQEIVSKMPDGADIVMTLKDNGMLDLENGKTRYHIKTMAVSEFPKLPDEKSYPYEFSMLASDLQKLLDQTKFSISQEETRYYLNGVYIHTTDDKALTTVSTDGHRLALASIAAPKGAEKLKGVIIPKKAVMEITRLLGDVDNKAEAEVALSIADTKLKLDLGGTVISTKLIDGKFPDYLRVIPQKNEKHITIDGNMFKAAVDRVSAISSDKVRSVKLKITNNNLQLTVSSQDHGDAEEELGVDYKGDEITLNFNCRYLLELLDAAASDNLVMEAQDSFTPVLFKNKNDPAVLYVLMPLRI